MKYEFQYYWAGEWKVVVETLTYEEALAYLERTAKDRWPLRIVKGNEIITTAGLPLTQTSVENVKE